MLRSGAGVRGEDGMTKLIPFCSRSSDPRAPNVIVDGFPYGSGAFRRGAFRRGSFMSDGCTWVATAKLGIPARGEGRSMLLVRLEGSAHLPDRRRIRY